MLLIVSFKNPWLETVGQTPGRGLEIQLRSGAPLDGRGRLWAVVIGISQYKYVPRESQLRFAHRDAQDFARLLQSPNGGAFPSNQIRLLLNQDATISAIRTSLGTWLARSVEPEDVVYIYFAGHGLVENEKEGYLLAHDSDPQNLYATALPVEELDRMLTERLRARTVVLIADACHAGRIGLSSRGGESRALITRYLDELGKTESSIFRLLATRANERSYEDEKWGGGHGVFTYYLLEGLRGRADKDQDGIVRAAELLTYLSETVPEATQALQHPRAAGYLDPRLPLAVVSRPGNTVAVSETRPSSLEIRGIPGTQVYVDNSFRGSIRPTGLLIIEGLSAGSHDLSIDPPNSEQFSQKVSLGTGKTTIELQRRAGATTQSSPLVAAIRTALQKKNVLETGGAWSLYQQMIASSPNEPQRRAVETMLAGSLEELGQEAINQYVHSSIWQLDRDSFRRGAIAFNNLKQLNSGDPSLEAKYLFCSGRALIVEGRAPEALPLLQRAVTLDPKAAYIYNALGVAQERAGADREALSAFTRATELAPNWSVPRLH
ncbi:MAG TPA: caspase family protein, partial [Blastocatellia bacterium]|nr:caspase family protein [Blastocatellia bacterium]